MQRQSAQPLDLFVPDAAVPSPTATTPGGRRIKYAQGIVFIVLDCFVWIAAAVMTKYIFDDQEFESPFLMSYIGASMLALFLPFQFYKEARFRREQQQDAAAAALSARLDSPDSFDEDLQRVNSYNDVVSVVTTRTQHMISNKTKRWNHKVHMLAALHIAPAMFVADWLFNAALVNTSVASSTVIVSTQTVGVFLLAVLTKLEPFSWAKFAGVWLGVLGTAFTAYHDSDESEAILGDVMALLAAVTYAVYTVQVRLFCPQDEELYSMELLLGYVGLVCMIPLMPAAVYMSVAQVNMSWTAVGLVALKGVLDFNVTDYLLFRAIVLTNATVATVGLGLTIPMAFLADWATGADDILSVYSTIGATAILFGFLIVNLVPDKEEGDENDESESAADANRSRKHSDDAVANYFEAGTRGILI